MNLCYWELQEQMKYHGHVFFNLKWSVVPARRGVWGMHHTGLQLLFCSNNQHLRLTAFTNRDRASIGWVGVLQYRIVNVQNREPSVPLCNLISSALRLLSQILWFDALQTLSSQLIVVIKCLADSRGRSCFSTLRSPTVCSNSCYDTPPCHDERLSRTSLDVFLCISLSRSFRLSLSFHNVTIICWLPFPNDSANCSLITPVLVYS